MRKLIFFFLVITSILNLNAIIRTVSLDGSMQFTQIQSAIDASASGDTVLVYPGRYLENVYFNGRNILLTSLYLYNPSDSIICSTVIDGHQNGSCVRFENGESYDATLNGFLLENGSGTLFNFLNFGGGVYIKDSFCSVKNCFIQNNEVSSFGGGIFLLGGFMDQQGLNLSNTVISNNKAFEGGGIFVSRTSNIYFDEVNRNSVFNNSGAVNDIMIMKENANLVINLDTMSVLDKNTDYIFVAGDYTLSVLHSTATFVNHDLYVSPEGNDSNSGLSFADPLQTIYKACSMIASDSLNPKTVYLAPGIYSRSQNNQFFPVNMRNYVSLIGADPENTIIDCEGLGGILSLFQNDNHQNIRNVSFINASPIDDVYGWTLSRVIVITVMDPVDVIIENCRFENCVTSSIVRSSDTPEIYPENTSMIIRNVSIDGSNHGPITSLGIRNLTIENLSVRHSTPNPDQDIWILPMCLGYVPYQPWRGNIRISNLLVEDSHNSISNWPSNICCSGLMTCGYSDFYITNMTMSNNSSIPDGGTLFIADGGSNIYLYNSLIYGNSPNKIWFKTNNNVNETTHLYVNNCLIENGEGAIQYENEYGNTTHWGTGNLDLDPLFQLTGDTPYALSPGSPCIDAGTTNIPGFTFPETDLAGNPRISGQGIDIGAYEYQQEPVDFTALPLLGKAPLTVQFTDLSENAQSWAWDFDHDGIIDSQLQNPVYIYQNPGVYTVKLTVDDGSGWKVKENYITVNPTGNNDVSEYASNKLSLPKPNPFSYKTSIKMTLKDRSEASLDIYNVKGQKVKTLFKGFSTKGEYDLVWEGDDSKGRKVSSGIYTAIMKVNGRQIATQKITVIK